MKSPGDRPAWAGKVRPGVGLAYGLALTLGSLLAAPSLADTPVAEEITPPPELSRTAVTEAGALTWRVAGGDGAQLAQLDYDDSSWVARAAVSPELLRNSVAWFRFHFLLPDDQGAGGSRLDIGGVEGNLAVYLNGTLLGEMRGQVRPAYARHGSFVLPAALMHPEGQNVLALRLSGFAGRPIVGIPKGPIRIAPLSTNYEVEERAKANSLAAERLAVRLLHPSRRVRELGILASSAQALIASGSFGPPLETVVSQAQRTRSVLERLPQATGSLTFGRFGQRLETGLLTCRLSPFGFVGATTSAEPAALAGTFGAPAGPEQVLVESTGPTGRVVSVLHGSQPAYRVFYPLAYPGFALETGAATMPVTLSDRLRVAWVDRWGIATDQGATKDAGANPRSPQLAEPWVLLYDSRGRRAPILVALPSPKLPIAIAVSGNKTRLTLPAHSLVRFCWPYGIDATAFSGIPKQMAKLRAWSNFMVPFALNATQETRGDRAFFRDDFAYLEAGAIPYAPLPPVLGLVLDAARPSFLPAGCVDLEVPTLAGPLWGFTGSAQARYDLPLPGLGISIGLRLGQATGSSGDLDLPGPLAGSALELAFTNRATAFLRWLELTARQRSQLETNSALFLPRAWSAAAWAEAEEPTTGTRFYWTLADELGGGDRLFNYGRANGLAIYGTSLAEAFTGAWGLATAHWQAIKRAFEWFEDSFDWAWQVPVDSVDGASTGDSEALASSYLGALAMARLAREAEPDLVTHYRALAGRMQVLVAGRGRLAQWGHRHGMLPAGLGAVGFDESGPIPATASSANFGELGFLPDLIALGSAGRGAALVGPVSLEEWFPARLESAGWNDRTRTAEVVLSSQKRSGSLELRLRTHTKPLRVLIDDQSARDWSYDQEAGTLVVSAAADRARHRFVIQWSNR